MDIQNYSYKVFQFVGFGMMLVFGIEALARAVIQAVREVKRTWDQGE